ncbi:hypothetical protein [Loktanella atrilutea]|nr:hypothetical protein [Loktanella atrilutea]
MVSDPTVIIPEIAASNGLFHVIDTAIMPPLEVI